MERANKEIEMLRKQYEAMSQELKEATQEAEVAKCRRDWAFQERDKIVAERESIRRVLFKRLVMRIWKNYALFYRLFPPLFAGLCVITCGEKGTGQSAIWPTLCVTWMT